MNQASLMPIEIDPRPCEWCGRTIDQHQCIDHGEGPEFYCYPDGDLVKQWELDDPRDRWRHTGDARPPAAPTTSTTKPYSTPRATVDAFFYVLGIGDVDYLTNWLSQHPLDVPTLHKLWEGTNARS